MADHTLFMTGSFRGMGVGVLLLASSMMVAECLAARTNAVCYAEWAAGYFNTTQLVDQSLCGPEADPDRDGACNLQEYAFSSDPTNGGDAGGISALAAGPGNAMSLAYSHVQSPADLIFTPKMSTDLISWSDATVQNSATSAPAGFGLIKSVTESNSLKTAYNTFFTRLDAAWTGRTWTTEIVWRHLTDGSIYYWTMTGTNRVAAPQVYGPLSSHWQLLPRGDFDGNAQKDFLWRDSNNGHCLIWLCHGSEYEVIYTQTNSAISSAWSAEDTGDFNGDGQDDIVWRNSNTGMRYIWYLNHGEYVAGDTLFETLSSYWTIRCGYFNEDNKVDLICRNTMTGDVVIRILDGVNVQTNVVFDSVSLHWDIAGVGDFDGDGKDDILWRHDTDGDLELWFMDGVTRLSTVVLDAISLNWQIKTLADFNGDHKMDILFQNSSSGVPALWIMDGAQRVAFYDYQAVSPTSWAILP